METTELEWTDQVHRTGAQFKRQVGFQAGGFLGGVFENRTIPEGFKIKMFMDDDGKESILISDGISEWFYSQEFGEPLHDWRDDAEKAS